MKDTRNYERVIWDRLSHSLIDLFHNGCQLMFSFICMIISLSDLFSMCKIRKNPYFQTRPERLIMIHIKDDSQEDIKVIGRHIERGLWKSFLKQVGGTYAPMKHKFDLNIEEDFKIMYHFSVLSAKKVSSRSLEISRKFSSHRNKPNNNPAKWEL